jgi:hypothetical protein
MTPVATVSMEMQSFKTNDQVVLKYLDTAAGVEKGDERKKPWLILVSG